MSRCPFYDQSKYGLKPKKKMCRNVATAKATFPTSAFQASLASGVTEIQTAWVCALHASMIRMAKQDQVVQWRKREAELDAVLDSSEISES